MTITKADTRAIEIGKRLYDDACGCCFHIVLSDGNFNRHSVDFCSKYAKEKGHLECLDLASYLQGKTNGQIRWFVRKVWKL